MLLYLQEFESCFADVIKATPSPVPNVFYFYAAMAYQSSVLLKKANLCPDITYHGLKKITEESGMLVGGGGRSLRAATLNQNNFFNI